MQMLIDIIIATYIPGDVVLIGMSHPSTFTIGKTYLVSLPIVFFSVTHLFFFYFLLGKFCEQTLQ